MGRTSVDVEEVDHGELKKLKAVLGLKTMGEVVHMLVDHYLGRGPASGSDGDDGERVAMEEDDKEAREKVQLLSYELLKDEPKAIKYFTGLSKECMDWVMPALSDAVWATLRFCVFRDLGQRAIAAARARRLLACPGLMCLCAGRGQA